ncbi:MAG: PKD domain-containing protein [Candidatus Thermoplasmatota archaeon]|nr:PKD domain-containing protein [Candidatus Thermoplasmatota archaeon]MDP7264374.1 PKD domain-containing protein [Candidatus Thermoplasmatota archaeon]
MKQNAIIIFVTLLLVNISVLTIVSLDTAAYPLDNFGTGVSTGLDANGNFNYIGVGNFNNDANMDMVYGSGQWSTGVTNTGLYAAAGNGAGTWTLSTITATDSFAGIAIADCDGDGSQEVYAGYEWRWANAASNGVGAWEWNGAAFAAAGITSPISSGGVADIEITNITGGPALDIVVGKQSGGLAYYEGNGASPISWTAKSGGLLNSNECTAVDVDDINNDGLPDIVAGQYGGKGLHIYTQNAAGQLWTARTASLPAGAKSTSIMGAEVGDINNDGNSDIVYSTHGGGMRTLLGNGGGGTGINFQWTTATGGNAQGFPGNYGSNGDFPQLQLADIDFDGDLDLLAPKASGGLYLFLGNGSEQPGNGFGWSLVSGKGLPTTGSYYGSNFIDFDNDSDLDIAGATWGTGVKVFETNLILPPHPIANAGFNQSVFLGDTVSLNGTNSTDAQDCLTGDPLGNILTYDWNITDQPQGSTLTDGDLVPSDASAAVSFLPTHSGYYMLSLVVRDSDLQYSLFEDHINITVIIDNMIPTANAGSDLHVETGGHVILNGSASNDTEDVIGLLSFDWNVSTGNPSIVTLSDESAIMPTFTAPDTIGDYYFTLAVKDSLEAWSIEDEVIVTVELSPNILPTADAGIDFSAFSNTTVTLNGNASDPDGDIVTWEWNCTSHPTLTLVDENSSAPSFTPNRSGQYSFTLTVLDDRSGWAEEDQVLVNIIEDNRPPTANAGADFTAYFGEVTFLNGSSSNDFEGYLISWNWTCLNYPNTTFVNGNSTTPSFIPDKVDIYHFTLKVMDDLGLWSVTDELNVTVIERMINKIPIANAGKDRIVHVNSTVILNGSRSNDPDGNISSWVWNCSSHTNLSFMYHDSAHPSFFAAEIGSYNISLAVVDDLGTWSVEDHVTITVVSEDTNITDPLANVPPSVKITSPRGGEIFINSTEITWIASDADSDLLSFTIELVNTSGGVVSTLAKGLGTEVRSWKWISTGVPDGSYRIRIKVFDGIIVSEDMSSLFTLKLLLDENDDTDDDDIDDDDTNGNNQTEGNGDGEEGTGAFFSSITGILIISTIFLVILISIVVLILLRSGKKREEVDEKEISGRFEANTTPDDYSIEDDGGGQERSGLEPRLL